jgi:hypothetical protein
LFFSVSRFNRLSPAVFATHTHTRTDFCHQIHYQNQNDANLEVREDALNYVTSLVLKVLRTLIAGKPNSMSEVVDRVRKTFPSPYDKDSLEKVPIINELFNSKKITPKQLGKLYSFCFPIGDFQSLLKEMCNVKTVDLQMTAFIISIIEYVAGDVFRLAAGYVRRINHNFISKEDISVALNADTELLTFLLRDETPDEDRDERNLQLLSDRIRMKSFTHVPQLATSLSMDRGTDTSSAGTAGDSSLGKDLHLLTLHESTSSNQLKDSSFCSTTSTMSYESVVKDLIEDEKSFIRDLRLIIKVFRDTFVDLLIKESESNSAANSLPSSPTSLTSPTSPCGGPGSVPSSPTHRTSTKITQADIDTIFSNIIDIEENSVNLLCLLEDAVEVMSSNDDAANPSDRSPKTGIESIGAVFEDMAEAAEFDVFTTFAQDVMPYRSMSPNGLLSVMPSKSYERLNQLLNDTWITNSLSTGGQGFLPAVRFVLPKLLNAVVIHCFTYFEYISVLQKLSPCSEDQESFHQAECLLTPLKRELEERVMGKKTEKFGENHLRYFGSDKKRSLANSKLTQELIKSIEGIDASLTPSLNEFLSEGILMKACPRSTERRAFLFEGALLLCKAVAIKRAASIVIPSKDHRSITHEYRVKEKILIKNIEVIDLCDSVEPDHNDHPHLSSMALNHFQNPISRNRMISNSSWGASTTSLASSTASSVPLMADVRQAAQSILSPNVRLLHAFEIRSKDSSAPDSSIVLCALSAEEKQTWMSRLIFLSTKSYIEKRLDALISEEAKKNPLRTPNPSMYRFAQADSDQNIIFEENKNAAGPPLIRGATLLKLVERLTYHQHSDPAFMKVFLTTYRSFCSPQELLDLLIERFRIPDIESSSREDIKRFEKDYVQPIQFRVLNVTRRWVDEHYYDFARDPSLEDKLIDFLKTSIGVKRNMKKVYDSVMKTIKKNQDFCRSTSDSRAQFFTFTGIHPPFEVWLAKTPDDYNILTLHPIEFARQLTLLESEYFKRVKPSELVGCAWTKRNKDRTSPNLLKMIHFSTNFTFWLMLQILETTNFEERVAVYSRVVEIMQVLMELNNFNGVFEIVSALNSASIHRLEHTKEAIPVKLKKALEEADELSSKHYQKYQEVLRSINPPCVPFLGMYLTNIVHIEEGNQDDIKVPVLHNNNHKDISLSNGQAGDAIRNASVNSVVSLINFSKRRKVAEITLEIQQYQNTPYCLEPHLEMRSFFESLHPLKSFEDPLPVIPESDSLISLASPTTTTSTSTSLENNNKKETPEMRLNNYMFAKSLDIEARGSRTPKKFDRRWPDLTLKSPGIKPSSVATLSRGLKTPFGLTSSSHNNSFTSGADQNQLSPTSAAACTTPVHSISDPTTPLSPTHLINAGTSSENSVFANVVIGPVPGSRGPPVTPTASAFPFPLPSSSPINLMVTPVPPPLPPRTGRGPSRPPPPTPTAAPAASGSGDSPPPLPPRGVTVPGQRSGPSHPPPLPPAPHHHPIHLPFTRNNSFTSSSIPPIRTRAALHQRQESRP